DLITVGPHQIEGVVDAIDLDPYQQTRVRGRSPVAHPLADETGSFEAGMGRFYVPAEDLLVEGGGLRDVDGGDLQVRKLAVDRLAGSGSILPVLCQRIDPNALTTHLGPVSEGRR